MIVLHFKTAKIFHRNRLLGKENILKKKKKTARKWMSQAKEKSLGNREMRLIASACNNFFPAQNRTAPPSSKNENSMFKT